MNQPSSSVNSPPPNTLLFHFKGIVLVSEPTVGLISQSNSDHCLLMFIGGAGRVDVGQEQYLFHSGYGYWLTPGESYRIAPLDGTVPEYYKITFKVITMPLEPQSDATLVENATGMPSIYHGSVLPEPREYIVSSSFKPIQLAEELFYSTQQTIQPHRQTTALRQQIMFQELLLLWQEAHVPIKHNEGFNPTLLHRWKAPLHIWKTTTKSLLPSSSLPNRPTFPYGNTPSCFAK